MENQNTQNQNQNPSGAGDFLEKSTPPKRIRMEVCDGWWLHPDPWTVVIAFYSDEDENFYVFLRMRDLFDFTNQEQVDEFMQSDPLNYEVYTYENIQRGLKKVMPNVRYEPLKSDIWVRVD